MSDDFFKILNEQIDWIESQEPVDYTQYLEHLKKLSEMSDTLRQDYELALSSAKEAKEAARKAEIHSVIGTTCGVLGVVLAALSLILQFFG